MSKGEMMLADAIKVIRSKDNHAKNRSMARQAIQRALDCLESEGMDIPVSFDVDSAPGGKMDVFFSARMKSDG